MIKRKARLWTRFMETRNPDVLMEYKRVQNKVRQETRKVIKHEQYDMSKQCKHNPKNFWNYVNSKFKSKQQIEDIKVQDEIYGQSTIISKDEDKAAAFGDFFSKIYTIEPAVVQDLGFKKPLKQANTPVIFKESDVLPCLNKCK